MTLFWKKIEVIKNDFMKYMIIRKNMIVFYNYFFRGKLIVVCLEKIFWWDYIEISLMLFTCKLFILDCR